MKHILLRIVSLIICTLPMIGLSATYATSLQEDMHVGVTNDIISTSVDETKVNLGQKAGDITVKGSFLGTIQTYLFGLIWTVAIAMFIYTGFKLFTSAGDEKEYGKAWKAFGFAVVGLTVIPLSYVLVKIVLGFNF